MVSNHSKPLEQEIEALCHKVFIQNPDGKKLHELLVDYYIKTQLVVNFQVPNPKEYAFYREGENCMIRQLLVHAQTHQARIDSQIKGNQNNGSNSANKPTKPAVDPFASPNIQFD
jgi:hypothetical protein